MIPNENHPLTKEQIEANIRRARLRDLPPVPTRLISAHIDSLGDQFEALGRIARVLLAGFDLEDNPLSYDEELRAGYHYLGNVFCEALGEVGKAVDARIEELGETIVAAEKAAAGVDSLIFEAKMAGYRVGQDMERERHVKSAPAPDLTEPADAADPGEALTG